MFNLDECLIKLNRQFLEEIYPGGLYDIEEVESEYVNSSEADTDEEDTNSQNTAVSDVSRDIREGCRVEDVRSNIVEEPVNVKKDIIEVIDCTTIMKVPNNEDESLADEIEAWDKFVSCTLDSDFI